MQDVIVRVDLVSAMVTTTGAATTTEALTPATTWTAFTFTFAGSGELRRRIRNSGRRSVRWGGILRRRFANLAVGQLGRKRAEQSRVHELNSSLAELGRRTAVDENDGPLGYDESAASGFVLAGSDGYRAGTECGLHSFDVS
jgi:hypothetical protein